MQILEHLQERKCPVCGDHDESSVAYPARIDEEKLDEFAFASRKLPEFMHLRLLRCPTCKTLYASPALAPEFLATAYRDASYDSQEEADYAASTYGEVLDSILPAIPDRDSALEIGAGNGAFLRRLREAGFRQVVGVEPSNEAVATAYADIRPMIRVGMFQANDFPPSSINLLSCFQTIEHIADPRRFCAEAYSLLRPNGALFLIGHDYDSWVTAVLGERSPIFDIEHQQLFSKASVHYLLKASGFADIHVATFRNRYPLAYWMKLLPIPLGIKRLLVPLSRKLLIGKLPVSFNIGNIHAVGFKRYD